MKKEITYWYVEPLNESQSMNYVETFDNELTAQRRAALMLRQLVSALTEASISIQVHCANDKSQMFFIRNNSVIRKKVNYCL